MKLLFALTLVCLSISAFAEEEPEWVEIDWSKVVPVEELPGFWDGRDIKAELFKETITRGSRIIGGSIVTPNAHPYQAGLLMARSGGGTGLCGGSLITVRTVLTAAHCIVGTTSTQSILGAHQITANEATQQRRTSQASAYRVHAQYNPNNLNNDIATIHLPTAVTINNVVRTIALPAIGNTESFAGIMATVSGWGRTSDGSSATSSVLRSTQVEVMTNAACLQFYSSQWVIASTICTSGVGIRGICNGDSGGPLTILRNGARMQVGVVNFAALGGCQQGRPSGYARITSFRQWIANNSV